LKELLAKIDPKLLFADGFDDCIIGLTIRDSSPVVLYSSRMVIEKLAQDMGEPDAVEYFEFNVSGAYVGEKTPVFWNDYDA
jgi:hypothetical protein